MLTQMGLLGDLFGGINAFFTAAALAAVWWTGFMQREDLRLQQRELTQTRIVFAQQTFEATFFRMLEMLREIGNSATFGETTGAKAWQSHAFYVEADSIEAVTSQDPDIIRRDIARYYENNFYPDREPWLGPYFRALYNLLKIVDEQEQLEEIKKTMYANIVRSQLSGAVLSILAVNGCSINLAKEMRKYIIKYRLLKHLRSGNFKQLISKIYPKETFEDRPVPIKFLKRG